MVLVVGETDWVPDVALAPDQPPLAVQEVALVEDHDSIENWPLVMLEGEAEIETVGEVGGGGVPVPSTS